MIDLHTHSTASDGSLSPTRLMEAAHSAGVEIVALTDHDTMQGVKEAEQTVKNLGLRLIPGVEIEIEWKFGEFHLLGLGLYAPSLKLQELLNKFSRFREERNLTLLDKMNRALGLCAKYSDIEDIAGKDNKSVGRPHFAQYLVLRNKAKNVEAAFHKYLGLMKPLYVKKKGADFDEAVCAIHESGGLAVMAHPATLYLSNAKLEKTLRDLKTRSLDGIEAWHPNLPPEKCAKMEALAEKLGLCITSGSDFHGEGRKDRNLGRTSGGAPIDNRFLPAALTLPSES